MGASQVRHCRGGESNEIFTKPLDEGVVGGGGGETGKEMAGGEFVGEGVGVDGGEEWVEGEGGAQGGGAEEEEGTGKGKGKGKEMKTPTRGNKKKKHSRRRRRQRKTIVREAISVKWCMGWIVLGRQMNVYFGINGCINTIDALIHVPIDMVTNPRKTSMQRTFVFIFVSRISTYVCTYYVFFFFHILLLHCVPGMLLNSNFIVLYPKFKLLSALVMQLKFFFFLR